MKPPRPPPRPSYFVTVALLMQQMRMTPAENGDFMLAARKILGSRAGLHALAFCAWELYDGEPAAIARLRTLEAVVGE